MTAGRLSRSRRHAASKRRAISIGSSGWSFFPFSVDAVRLLNRAGFAVVVVTNQAGIARGIFNEAFVAEAHAHIARAARRRAARASTASTTVRTIPTASVERVSAARATAASRSPGMLQRAPRRSSDLDLARSFVVGDRWHDVEAGQARRRARRSACAPGYGATEEARPQPARDADGIVDNLMEAVSWILRA